MDEDLQENEIEFHANETFDDEAEDARSRASSNGSSVPVVKSRKRRIEREEAQYALYEYEQVRKRLKKLSDDSILMQMNSSQSGGEDNLRLRNFILKIKLLDIQLESAYQRCILNKQKQEEDKLVEPEQFVLKEDPKEIDSRSIYVGNITEDITEEELGEAFGIYGTVKRITIKYTYWGVRKGFAFIEYSTKGEAQLAGTQEYSIRGNFLVVKPKRTNIPGYRRHSAGGYNPYTKRRRVAEHNVVLTPSDLVPIIIP